MRHLEYSSEPLCGVYAVALTTPDKSLMEMYEFTRTFLKKRSNWKGRLYNSELRSLLSAVGTNYTTHFYEKKSLKTVYKTLDESKHYIVFITGHFFTLHKRMIYDQYKPNGWPIEQYMNINRRVKSVYEIIK